MTLWKIRILFLVAYTLPVLASAQSDDSLLNELSRKWVNAKLTALKTADLMPAENYNYKPAPELMSFGEQLIHIGDNMRWLSTKFLSADTSMLVKKSTIMDKAEVIKYVADAYDMALLAQSSMSGKNLNEMVSFFAGPLSKRQIMALMHDHQTHHLGELVLYLRLQGLKPPAYVGW